MTLLEKIDFLIKDRHLNKRKLSLESKIPYSTLDNLWKRGSDSMRLPTFKRLCHFFKVSMDSMAYDELDIQPYDPDDPPFYTSPHEQEIIKRYRETDIYGKGLVNRALNMDDAPNDNSNLLSAPEETGTPANSAQNIQTA